MIAVSNQAQNRHDYNNNWFCHDLFRGFVILFSCSLNLPRVDKMVHATLLTFEIKSTLHLLTTLNCDYMYHSSFCIQKCHATMLWSSKPRIIHKTIIVFLFFCSWTFIHQSLYILQYNKIQHLNVSITFLIQYSFYGYHFMFNITSSFHYLVQHSTLPSIFKVIQYYSPSFNHIY